MPLEEFIQYLGSRVRAIFNTEFADQIFRTGGAKFSVLLSKSGSPKKPLWAVHGIRLTAKDLLSVFDLEELE